MSDIYVLGYSDFGFLLMDKIFNIAVKKVEGYDYGVYEDILKSGQICIKRRFLDTKNSIIDSDDKSEPLLPEDISRFEMTYKGLRAFVVSSLDADTIFADDEADDDGFIRITEDRLTCASTDPELLAEDVVILASNGQDLNAVPNQE